MSHSRTSAGPDAARRLPRWVWLLLSVLLIVIVILAVLLLIRVGPNTPDSSPSATSESTPTATPSPVPTPTSTSAVGQGKFDSDMPDVVLVILNSGNVSVLDQGGYFTDPVVVVVAASGVNEPQSPAKAVASMQFLVKGQPDNSWSATSDSTLAVYRSGPYGKYFPQGAIVAQSKAGYVVAFMGDRRKITTMFIAAQPESLKP
jgi:cytoskeletal protein RodZ